ncbi:MAG TPA: inositol monophosphatase [Candidatus Saccharimonadales bacterium]|nr:inositol monophosphatase [Candidatus Saccharimonadales bacterium]
MYQQELKVAKLIAEKAGKIMLEYFDGEQELEHKPDPAEASEVTIADKKINSLVIAELSKHFDDGVIGEEESTSEYGPGRKWFCDPIDGTKAFVIGVPTAMFSLGLVVDGSPVLGVAYDPFLDRLYWGIKGQGSYCNEEKLAASKHGVNGHYVVVSSAMEKAVKKPHLIENLSAAGAKIDAVYGAVFKSCLVAHGRVVGYFEEDINAHDIAAVQVVVEEAGGRVTAYDGKELDYTKPFKGAVISNGTAHAALLKCING